MRRSGEAPLYTLYIEDIAGGQTHEHSFAEGELVIGRSRERCDIVLPADNVSRRHSRLYVADGRCYVQDMGSSNGVFVDGVRIRDVREIETSNRIRIGDYVLYVGADQVASAAGPSDYGRLVGITPAPGQSYPIREPVSLIGRGKDTAVTVIDHSVSRIHAKLTVTQNGDFVLQDLRSSNGTFVNDRRIEQNVLRHGDRVRFGSTEFHFEVPGQAAAVAEPTASPADMVPVSPSHGAFGAAPQAGVGPAGWGQPGPAGHGGHEGYEGYEGYEDYDEAPRSRKWLVILIVLGLLAAAAVVLVLLLSGGSGTGGSGAKGDESSASGGGSGEGEEGEESGGHEAEDPSGRRGQEEGGEEQRQEEIAEDLAAAKTALEGRDWVGAIEAYARILSEDAEHAEAIAGTTLAERESTVATAFAKAKAEQEQRAFDKALVSFAAIPRNSVYRAEAVATIAAIRAMPARLLADAEAAERAGDWPNARDRYQELLMIEPDNPVIMRRLKKAQRRAAH